MSPPASRCLPFLACFLALGLLSLPALASSGDEGRIYSQAELKALDRLNDLWLTVRPADTLSENLARLRRSGFAEADIVALEPQLRRAWQVDLDRHFGHLPPATIDQIKAIDEEFSFQLRAARLRQITGHTPRGASKLTPREIDVAWHRAIMRVLDYDEIAEFRLLNHGSARKVSTWARRLGLNDPERRTLNEWQREFDAIYNQTGANYVKMSDWRREARLDLHERIRGLLGDERAAIYLQNSQEDFGHLSRALAQTGSVTATQVLDVWKREQQFGIASHGEPLFDRTLALANEARTKIASLIGPAAFVAYVESAELRRVYPRPPDTRTAAHPAAKSTGPDLELSGFR